MASERNLDIPDTDDELDSDFLSSAFAPTAESSLPPSPSALSAPGHEPGRHHPLAVLAATAASLPRGASAIAPELVHLLGTQQCAFVVMTPAPAAMFGQGGVGSTQEGAESAREPERGAMKASPPPGVWDFQRSEAGARVSECQRSGAARVAPPPGTWAERGARSRPKAPVAPSHFVGDGLGLVSASLPTPELNHVEGVTITTLTINHVPIAMGKTQLVTLLDRTGFGELYNYLYLPWNCTEGTNRGHAFVNFCTPQGAKSFFKAWHGARLCCGSTDSSNSASSVVTVAISSVQGFEACTARWTKDRLRRLKTSDLCPLILGLDSEC